MRLTAVRAALVAAAAMGVTGPARAQTVSYNVDSKASLAWWQVNPHLNHLWATTCPMDPSWRPGEGRSMQWASEYMAMRSKTGYAAVRDTIIPLYPRKRVRSICPESVTGTITADDSTTWHAIKGVVTVKGADLITGLDMRDEYARKAVLQTASWPTMTFAIDSVGSLKSKGDTTRGNIYGKFTLRGLEKPAMAQYRSWHEAGGFRVQAQFMIETLDLTQVYGISNFVLGLGVGQNLWNELHMGVDVLLRQPTP